MFRNHDFFLSYIQCVSTFPLPRLRNNVRHPALGLQRGPGGVDRRVGRRRPRARARGPAAAADRLPVQGAGEEQPRTRAVLSACGVYHRYG